LSVLILDILFTHEGRGRGNGSNKLKEVGPQTTRGSDVGIHVNTHLHGMQGDGFATKLGGIMELTLWLCALLLIGFSSSMGLVTNYVVLLVSNLVLVRASPPLRSKADSRNVF
jgi:hypothetical protein